MRKAKLITLIVLVMLLTAIPCTASHRVAGEYDLITELWTWEAAGDYDIVDWLGVGYSLRCLCDGWAPKTIIPSWIPIRQDYEVWAEARYGDWTVRVTDWCNHWLSQSGVSRSEDTHGLTVRVQWQWQ